MLVEIVGLPLHVHVLLANVNWIYLDKYRIAGYFRGVYISRTATSILVCEKYSRIDIRFINNVATPCTLKITDELVLSRIRKIYTPRK